MSHPLIEECHNIWMDKWRFDDAELKYHTHELGDSTDLAQNIQPHQQPSKQPVSSASSLVNEIAKARQQIQKSLHGGQKDAVSSSTDNVVTTRLENLKLENHELRKVTEDLQAAVKKLASRISALECSEKTSEKPMTKQAEKDEEEEEDDDIDLFGSDEEDDEEAEKLKAERIQAYQEKKSKKTQVIAKSNIILDVKPWEDTTDMAEMEKNIRTIEMDGLLWGTAKLVPVGYGIKKLVISCVVVDDKVSIDDLEEQITAFEDHVQSVDIAAFNKI